MNPAGRAGVTVPDWAADVEGFGLPYHHVPFPNEPELIELLRGQCDLVVLARYMRILSGDFLTQVGVPIINIHHSFLPAFAGATPTSGRSSAA